MTDVQSPQSLPADSAAGGSADAAAAPPPPPVSLDSGSSSPGNAAVPDIAGAPALPSAVATLSSSPSIDWDAVEHRTITIGRSLFASIRGDDDDAIALDPRAAPSKRPVSRHDPAGAASHSWWESSLDNLARVAGLPARWIDERMMRLSMTDGALKSQLFRFVDVLPSLRTSKAVNAHLREYLMEAGGHLPRVLRQLVRWIPCDGALCGPFAELTRLQARRMARRFIAASDPHEAGDVALEIRRAERSTFTIDVLGEAVLSEGEAARQQSIYLDLLDQLAPRLSARDVRGDDLLDRDHAGGAIPRVNVSIKLSSLFSQFDPIEPAGTSLAVRERLRPILRKAQAYGAFVNFDMEQYAYKGLTLRIFKEICLDPEFRDWPDIGIAMQAYLRETEADLRELAEWVERERGTPVTVRLVKGAYWDFETIIAAQNGWPAPVFTNKDQTDANYEACTALLLKNWRWLRPAIASHNVRSIARAMAVAEAMEIPRRAIEFQMLYGMAEPIRRAIVDRGERVRVYLPVGPLLPGMAYLVRRLLENTSNESFLRAGFVEGVPEEELLMNPIKRLAQPVKPLAGGLLNRLRGVGMPSRARSLSQGGSPRFILGDSTEGERGSRGSALPGAPPVVLAPFQNEPITDFSQPAARAAMISALEEVKQVLGRSYPLVIGGRDVETHGRIESINPWRRSQKVGFVHRATEDHVREAIAVAKAAFETTWRDAPVERRAELLLNLAGVMRRRRFELCAIEIYECAKPWREADGDVAEAIDFCEYYAREMLRLANSWHRDLPGETNRMIYDARGVCVVISPWNFPLAILTGMAAAAVVAGNTVILKPAEQSPVIAAYLQEMFEEAGAPAGVVNYLPGVGEEIGPVLVDHPEVSVVAFTGSRAVGLNIHRLAADTPPGQNHVTRVICEMGGKNAIIVDADADLDEAIAGVISSAFGYAGQKCSACSRVIVLDEIHDAFLARLIDATRSLRVGPADDPATYVPPVIDGEARDRIWQAIEIAKREAKLVYAGDVGAIAHEGYFIAPHVFSEVTPDSSLGQNEIFGPILAVMRATDLTHAIRIANGTLYALTGGIYSRNPASIERAKREVRVGNLYVNRRITGALVDRQPFGGFKLSGIGSKAGGPDYLLQYLTPRVITENTMRRGFAGES